MEAAAKGDVHLLKLAMLHDPLVAHVPGISVGGSNRPGIVHRLDFYTGRDIHEIVRRSARILGVEDHQVALAGPRGQKDAPWRSEGTYGLDWPGGSGQVGAIVESGPRQVVR